MVAGEISFGRFRLNLERRELRRDNTQVRLGGRALDILCVLASAGGAIVTKDELMARVWAGVVVEENNIQVHISALRKALEEDGNGESWIVTVAGRGYRLLRPREPPAADDPGPARSLPVPDKPSLAVLPFLNLSGDPEQEYFADGMVEEMPSRPGEFHPEPLTDPDLTLSRHPARATERRLPPPVENWSSSCCQLAHSQRR